MSKVKSCAKKAAIYARYSSDNQREESIDAQVRTIKEWAENNEVQIVKTYIDEARSATIDNRPQFLEMINHCKLGVFDLVIVHKLDRFARNRYDSAFYRRELKRNNVKLISVTEHLNDSPESIILESVLEGMAEYYSRNLAREVMKGMRETAYQCKHNGGLPPLGYDIDHDRKYVINEKEARTVRLIFQMYADGAGLKSIAREMNSQGFKTKRGNLFGNNSIHELIRNEKYCGNYVFNRTVAQVDGKRNNHRSKDNDAMIRIEGGIPAIVDKKTFHMAQERLENNKKGRNKAKVDYLLSGLIFCGICNGAMVGNTRTAGRNKDKYSTYECSSRKRKDHCAMKSIRKEYVESAVLEEMEANIFSESGLDTLAKRVYKYALTANEDYDRELEALEKEKEATQKQINNIIDAVASGLKHHSFQNKMDELEDKLTNITSHIFEVKAKAEISLPSVETIKKYLERDKYIKNKNPDEQKRIIRTFVKSVNVNTDFIEVTLIVDFDGGGGGNRTRVRE